MGVPDGKAAIGGRRQPSDLPQGMRDAAQGTIPLGPARPEKAAGVIFFLRPPRSNLVHGQVTTASSGRTTGTTR